MRSLILAILLLSGWSAQAQPVVDGGLLGVDEAALRQLFPQASRLAKPVLGPHHVLGNWRLDHAPLANLSLAATFFFHNRQLVRIEQQAALGQPMCPAPKPDQAWFAQLQARYGSGLAANYPDERGLQQQSVAWVAQGVDVSLYLTQQPTHCALRLVFQPHVDKDASAL
jgi:hypothetical protein